MPQKNQKSTKATDDSKTTFRLKARNHHWRARNPNRRGGGEADRGERGTSPLKEERKFKPGERNFRKKVLE